MADVQDDGEVTGIFVCWNV